MPGAGFEPARPRGQRLLRPPRLPFRHPGAQPPKLTVDGIGSQRLGAVCDRRSGRSPRAVRPAPGARHGCRGSRRTGVRDRGRRNPCSWSTLDHPCSRTHRRRTFACALFSLRSVSIRAASWTEARAAEAESASILPRPQGPGHRADRGRSHVRPFDKGRPYRRRPLHERTKSATVRGGFSCRRGSSPARRGPEGRVCRRGRLCRRGSSPACWRS